MTHLEELDHALPGAEAAVTVEVLPPEDADKEETGRHKPGHHDHDHHLDIREKSSS